MSNLRRFGLDEITPVVKNLILLNLSVAAITFFYPNITLIFANHYPSSPYFGNWQIVTSIFTHFGFAHLIFNMFSLYMFGCKLEIAIGSQRFIFLYLSCGILAGLFCWLIDAITVYNILGKLMVNQNDVANNIQLIPIVTTHSAGASGAIFGVMAAFAYLFPNTYFRDIFFPIPIKAKIMVPLMIVFSYVAILRGQNDGIGHYAHIGGAIFGFLLVLFWNKTNKKDFY